MNTLVRLLLKLALLRPAATVAGGGIVTLLALAYAARTLTFDTNQDHLISKDAAYFRDYERFLREFGDWEYIYVVVRARDKPDRAKAFASELAERLKTRPDLFAEVTEKIPVAGLEGNALLLLPEREFSDLEAGIKGFAPELAGFLRVRDSAGWYAWAEDALKRKAADFGSKGMERFWGLFKDALSAPFDAEALGRLDPAEVASAFTGRYVDRDGYLFSGDGGLLFVQALPGKDYTRMEIVREPLEFLRHALASLRETYPDLEFGVTGRPVLQNDEAVSTGNDSALASFGSLLLVVILFAVFVRRQSLTLYSLAALFSGIAVTTALVAILFGSVNLLTIVFAIILIGMGMDYGIHFLLHYHALRDSGIGTREAIEAAIREDGPAILISAGLTALGFASALATDFLGLKQLGAIIAFGILVCCLMQLTLFPALIAVFERGEFRGGDIIARFRPVIGLAAACASSPRAVMLVSLALAALCLPFAKLSFDHNLLNLQDPTQESVVFERVVAEESDVSTWFLAGMTPDRGELERWAEKASRLPSVGRVESLLDLVPPQAEERLGRIAALKGLLERPPSLPAESALADTLRALAGRFEDLASKAFSSGDAAGYAELSGEAERLSGFADGLENSPFFTPPNENEFRERLDAFRGLFERLFTPAAITEADVPARLLARYRSPGGLHSLALYPRENVWEWDELERFIAEARTVIPDVTGAPVTTYESAIRMRRGFFRIGLLTAVIVFLLLVAVFRGLKAPLLIFAKLALTFWIVFGLMGLAGIRVNLANFFALPILIGANVDHGVYLLHHYREHGSLPRLFQLTVPPVLLSCLANIAGFASLALVRHRGLAGFGLIMMAGTFVSLAVTVVWLPAAIRILYRKAPSRP